MAETITIIVAVLLVGGLLSAVLFTQRVTDRSLANISLVQLVVGIVSGAAAAGLVLVFIVDLVPDEVERAAVPVVIAAITLILVALLILKRRIH